MFWIDVLSRVVHVSMAIVLLGGSLFSLLVLQPTLKEHADLTRGTFINSLRARWKIWVHTGIALFLITGFYNYVRAMPNHKGDGLYHALVGTKILVALVVFFLASVLVGRSQKFEAWRQNAAWPMRLVCALGMLIVLVSGFLKVSAANAP